MLNSDCPTLDRATERGTNPTKRPVAIRVVVSCNDKVETLARGGSSPLARKISAMSGPRTLS